MFIKVGGTAFTADVSFATAEVSKHTRRPLERASARFMVRTPEYQQEVLGALGQQPATVALVDNGNETAFVVLRHSVAQAMGEPRWQHDVTLRQVEDLSPSGLVIDGLEILPDQYSESERHGGIVVSLSLILNGTTTTELEQHLRALCDGRYFDLVRNGLEDRPRRVRCGRCRWEQDGDRRTYRLNLIERLIDDADPAFGWMRPEVSNLLDCCAQQSALLQALIDQLRVAGIISDAQVANLAAQAGRRAADLRWGLLQVPLRQGDG